MRIAVCLVHVLALLVIQTTLTLGMQVTIPGRCSDVCSNNIESVFFNCIDEVDSGCALRICNSPRRAARCALKSGVPDVLFTGERASFSRFNVLSNVTTNIGIRGFNPKTDVYFLVDGTGSVGTAIGSFRRTFGQLTEALNESGDYAYGLGIFRDETELDMGFSNLQAISTDISMFEASIRRVTASGGGDTEEANLVALFKIATGDFVNWREGANRVVLLLGDAVGHEPTCFDDVVLNRRVVTQALNDANITVQMVGTATSALNAATSEFGCGGSQRQGRGQSSFIAIRTGGSLTTLDRDTGPEVLRVFSEVLGNSSMAVDIANRNCNAGLNIMFDPRLPRQVMRGERLKITFSPRRRICAMGTFRCALRFTFGGSVSAPLVLRIINPEGCPS